jgi:hypothetical protein
MTRPPVPAYDEMLNYDPPFRLLEEARKSWNYVVSNEIVYSVDSSQVALDSQVGVAKDYLKGNVWIEVHVTFQIGFKTKRDVHHPVLPVDKSKNAFRHLKINCRGVRRNSHVLVDNAHLVETPQEMALDGFGIPSRIWLKRFNDGGCLCGHSVSLGSKHFVILLSKNRELRVSGVRKRQLCQAPHKLVQCGSEIVKNITNDERNCIGGISYLDFDPTPLIFRIVLGAKLARFGFEEDAQLLPQSIKMYFRPGCLQIGVSQTHDGYSSL